MLQIYNSLTKQKQPFQPLVANTVNMYVCGMTVYDLCHLGHARVLVAFDVVARYLRQQGYTVNYIRNITDIDDKIIKRAQENQESVTQLTERFIQAMHEDLALLNIMEVAAEPRATQHIPQIIALIERLLAQGYAYTGSNGDVYYHVERFENYGKLAHKNIDDLQAGARVDIAEQKHNPLDFVLWKLEKPGEPSWDSPWGKGRPGWHIECSAMAMHCLGEQFDIHGGGFDLQFPHHENEIAQSEAVTHKNFVNTWMHVGFLTINKQKMSKSLGNFFTIRDILKEYSAEVVRYFLITSHYRSPLHYSTENLEIAKGALARFYIALRDLPEAQAPSEHEFIDRFQQVMDDDFNTPEALAVLFDIVREINRLRANEEIDAAAVLGALLRQLGGVLGILQQDPQAYLTSSIENQNEVAEIERLIAERNQARQQKDWAQADRIRDQLTNLGVELEDGSEGTVWRKL
ncbi:MAG: cysteine--tRNA ligase [Gammaproteobacteria bacterium]